MSVVLALAAFILHADLLQHMTRRRIAFEMWCPNAV
jgi:hypothetical protein